MRVLLAKPPTLDPGDPRVVHVERWLPEDAVGVRHVEGDGMKLAAIVYTSGTTGRPKGVMLSHHNMLTNAHAATTKLAVLREDVFLSFLPLSHTFERTVGYYLTVMTGSVTAYARSVQQLSEDLQTIRPTILISVPRIYERVYGAIKARLAEGPRFRRWLFWKAEGSGAVAPGAEYERLRRELAARLEAVVDPATGQHPVSRVFLREEIYRNFDPQLIPDLIVTTSRGYRISWQSALGGMPDRLFEDNARGWSGDHCTLDPDVVPGVLFSSRPLERRQLAIIDVYPTLLRLLEVRPPEEPAGQPFL